MLAQMPDVLTGTLPPGHCKCDKSLPEPATSPMSLQVSHFGRLNRLCLSTTSTLCAAHPSQSSPCTVHPTVSPRPCMLVGCNNCHAYVHRGLCTSLRCQHRWCQTCCTHAGAAAQGNVGNHQKAVPLAATRDNYTLIMTQLLQTCQTGHLLTGVRPRHTCTWVGSHVTGCVVQQQATVLVN